MKLFPLALPICVLLCAGCGHLDTTPEPIGDRTLNGTVNYSTAVALAPGAVVTVRLLNVSPDAAPGQVLDEQTITVTGNPPVPFQLTYKAEDIQPPKRARVEARLAVNGKLRFYSVAAYPVTPGNADSQIALWMDSATK
ncbi:MAG TPA: YbaY family lipoprotein [Opitutaceae bacterium]|nr:YbaY family lipoprotein [Opitutaceae bacterium]